MWILGIEKMQGIRQTKKKEKALYNYLVRQLLDDVVTLHDQEDRIMLIMDRHHNKKDLRKAMNEYLVYMTSRLSSIELDIEHQNSYQSPGLQLVDFVSGAVFRKYNSHEDT